MASDKYKDKYADVWSQMPISDNVLDLRSRAVEMTQEGRKRWDDMNKPEQFDPPEETSMSRDAGYGDIRQEAQQPFGTVQYEGRPQSLLSEGDMADYENYLAEVRRGNSGVEEREEVPYEPGGPEELPEVQFDEEGDQNLAEGGPVLPEDDNMATDEDAEVASEVQDEQQDEADYDQDNANEMNLAMGNEGEELQYGNDMENAADQEEVQMAGGEERPDDPFSTNGPAGEDADDDDDDDEYTPHPAVQQALAYGRAQNGLTPGSPETAERGVLPAPDVKAALTAATEDPEAEAQAEQAQKLQKNAKMVGYLSGKGSMPSEQAKEIEQKVDPTGTMDPDTLRVEAMQYAQKTLGDEGAFAYLQLARQHYDMQRNFAAAAASGSATKPADLNVAAQAANKAFSYLPDGRNVTFVPTRNGMRVRVA